MAVRTKRLFGPTSPAPGTNTVVYTCPVGETAILKFLTIVNMAGVDGVYVFAIGSSASGVLRVVMQNVPAQRSVLLETWIVLGPGEQLRALAPVTGEMTVSGSGAELLGVAD